VVDILPHHPILGLPDVTTPKDVNNNTVTISPKLYEQMADISTIGMPETQEEDSSKDNEDMAPSDNDSALPVAAFTVPISWFTDVDYSMMDANGQVDPVGWQFQGRDGKWMCEDDNVELKHSPLDYFMAAFPPNALKRILILTNKSLQNNKWKEIELGELLQFFVVVLLITKFDFGQRHKLWNAVSTFRYIASPQFGIRTGMCRNRFKEIWMDLVFGAQSDERPDECQ
jgi:Transposase IS4